MMTITQFCGLREYTPEPITDKMRKLLADAGRIGNEKVRAEAIVRNERLLAKLPQRFNTHQLTQALADYAAEQIAKGCKKTKPFPTDPTKRNFAAYSVASKACEYGQIKRAGYEVGTGHGPRGRIVVYEKAQQQ